MSLSKKIKSAFTGLGFAHIALLSRTANKVADGRSAPTPARPNGTSATLPKTAASATDEVQRLHFTQGKRATRTEVTGDDSEDTREEMAGKGPAAEARRRERARCAAIMLSAEGLARPALAKQLAFGTRMTRVEALTMLELSPAEQNARVRAGALSASPAIQALAHAKSWDAAFAKTGQKVR